MISFSFVSPLFNMALDPTALPVFAIEQPNRLAVNCAPQPDLSMVRTSDKYAGSFWELYRADVKLILLVDVMRWKPFFYCLPSSLLFVEGCYGSRFGVLGDWRAHFYVKHYCFAKIAAHKHLHVLLVQSPIRVGLHLGTSFCYYITTLGINAMYITTLLQHKDNISEIRME